MWLRLSFLRPFQTLHASGLSSGSLSSRFTGTGRWRGPRLFLHLHSSIHVNNSFRTTVIIPGHPGGGASKDSGLRRGCYRWATSVPGISTASPRTPPFRRADLARQKRTHIFAVFADGAQMTRHVFAGGSRLLFSSRANPHRFSGFSDDPSIPFRPYPGYGECTAGLEVVINIVTLSSPPVITVTVMREGSGVPRRLNSAARFGTSALHGAAALVIHLGSCIVLPRAPPSTYAPVPARSVIGGELGAAPVIVRCSCLEQNRRFTSGLPPSTRPWQPSWPP